MDSRSRLDLVPSDRSSVEYNVDFEALKSLKGNCKGLSILSMCREHWRIGVLLALLVCAVQHVFNDQRKSCIQANNRYMFIYTETSTII